MCILLIQTDKPEQAMKTQIKCSTQFTNQPVPLKDMNAITWVNYVKFVFDLWKRFTRKGKIFHMSKCFPFK